jgi:hypothetical protein
MGLRKTLTRVHWTKPVEAPEFPCFSRFILENAKFVPTIDVEQSNYAKYSGIVLKNMLCK